MLVVTTTIRAAAAKRAVPRDTLRRHCARSTRGAHGLFDQGQSPMKGDGNFGST
jgi:hypothetical protein